jgi:DNA-binding MarR family transcriptional regulator
MDETIGQLEAQMAVLARRIENTARKQSALSDMDRASYVIARTLDESGRLTVNDIARHVNLDASTVTRQLAVMDSRGFIERHSDPDDRRSSVIALTPLGRKRMRALSEARRKRFAVFVADWSPEDVAHLARLLERFNQSVKAVDPQSVSPSTRAPRLQQHRQSVLSSRRSPARRSS